jgi:DNA-binding transcriptional regulator YiaG
METEPLRKLKAALMKGANRKRFLLVLSISPDLAGHYLLEDLAMLLDVEVELLSKFLNTSSLMLEKKQKCKESFEILSNRHFRRLLEIESELEREENEEKRVRLESLRQWNQRVYKAKIEQIRSLELNLSHSQIGRLLNVPKGTVDSSIHYMKRLISQCLDET